MAIHKYRTVLGDAEHPAVLVAGHKLVPGHSSAAVDHKRLAVAGRMAAAGAADHMHLAVDRMHLVAVRSLELAGHRAAV